MKIFLDFDRTLYDLDAFHEDSRDVVECFGVPRSEYDRTREYFARQSGASGAYHSPERHLEYFDGVDDATKAAIAREIRRLAKAGRRYVFDGVPEFLASVRDKEVSILSFGDDEFQRFKINGSGLELLVREIIVTTGSKWDVMRERIQGSTQAVFVDDHGSYFTEVPPSGIMAVHFIRQFSCLSPHGCHAQYHAHDFDEITRIIQEM